MSQTEDEASGQMSSPSTTQPDGVPGDVPEHDNQGSAEKVTTEEETELSPEESDDKLPVAGVSSEDCGREEEDEDQPLLSSSDKIDKELIENDIRFSTDKDVSQSELDNTNVVLSRSNSMRDMSAEELRGIEHDEEATIREQETTLADDKIRGTSDVEHSTSDAEKVTEEFPYYGLADIDVCATELQQTNQANVVDEDLNTPINKEEDISGHSLLSLNRPPTAALQVMEPQENETLENQELTETHFDAHELLASTEDAGHHMQEIEKVLDTEGAPQEKVLVEINFDDVPEVQELVGAEDQEPVDERSAVEQSEQRSERQSHEDIIGAESAHGEDGVQNNDEPTTETDGQEKEVNTEGEERDDHEAADISMEMDARDLGIINDGYEEGWTETVLTGQPSAETTNLEIKTDSDNDDETDNEEVENPGNTHPETLNTHNETKDRPEDPTEDGKREISREVIEDTQTGPFSEIEEERPSEFHDDSAGRRPNESKPQKEQEEVSDNKAGEESRVQMQGRALTPVEPPQPEDTHMEGTEDTVVTPRKPGADDRAEEVEINDEGHGRSNAVGDGSIESYNLGAGWAHGDVNPEDQRPPETGKDVMDHETKDGDKVTFFFTIARHNSEASLHVIAFYDGDRNVVEQYFTFKSTDFYTLSHIFKPDKVMNRPKPNRHIVPDMEAMSTMYNMCAIC